MLLVNWIFFDSIFGPFIVGGAVFIFFSGLKKILPIAPSPIVIGVIAGVVAFAALQSVPRYQFERKLLNNLEGKSWVEVVQQTQVGALWEPLTWFKTPIGNMLIVLPADPSMGGFQEVFMSYQQEAEFRHADPECELNRIQYSAFDASGVLRQTTMRAQEMTEQEYNIYCEHNWSQQRSEYHKALYEQAR